MKFSILISSYNKGNYIDKCIKSCLSQSNQNLEIIVVDNYSSDEGEKLLRKYSKKEDEPKQVKKEWKDREA